MLDTASFSAILSTSVTTCDKSSPSVPPKLAWHRVNENPLPFQRQMVLCIRVEVGMTVAAQNNERSKNINKNIKKKGLVMCNDILRVFEKLGHPSATLCLKSEILKRTAAHMAWGIYILTPWGDGKRMKFHPISLWFQDVREGFSMILVTSWDQHVQMRDKSLGDTALVINAPQAGWEVELKIQINSGNGSPNQTFFSWSVYSFYCKELNPCLYAQSGSCIYSDFNLE